MKFFEFGYVSSRPEMIACWHDIASKPRNKDNTVNTDWYRCETFYNSYIKILNYIEGLIWAADVVQLPKQQRLESRGCRMGKLLQGNYKHWHCISLPWSNFPVCRGFVRFRPYFHLPRGRKASIRSTKQTKETHLLQVRRLRLPRLRFQVTASDTAYRESWWTNCPKVRNFVTS